MKHRLRWLPWLSLQMIAANVTIVLMLGVAWYWMFTNQSMVYSDRLMSTFIIEPGRVHAMFVDEVERQLWTGISIGLAFAVLASIAATLYIVRPLRALARPTDRLRQGDYRVRAQHQSGEIGHLAETFNALDAALEQEEGRRARYLAGLGHELQTPITSLRGYTEGLEDGVFQADAKYFSLMSDEINHLTALTQFMEAMELSALDQETESQGVALPDLLADVQRRWLPQFEAKSLRLRVDSDNALSLGCISLSRKSPRHIIDNLMLHVLRYADTTPKCCIVLTRHNPQTIEMVFINGAEGLPSQSHPLRFDRFFCVS
ncbi:MAG: HAMP domain-containing sensor histidine kinase [Pseudomonadota bacterium]|nr:HAMP domain-containing sensor histidine kinase [Pseudomonadota bacterium]